MWSCGGGFGKNGDKRLEMKSRRKRRPEKNCGWGNGSQTAVEAGRRKKIIIKICMMVI